MMFKNLFTDLLHQKNIDLMKWERVKKENQNPSSYIFCNNHCQNFIIKIINYQYLIIIQSNLNVSLIKIFNLTRLQTTMAVEKCTN
jgi:hypothetical protein